MAGNFPDSWLNPVPLLVLATLSGCNGHETTGQQARSEEKEARPVPKLEYELVLDVPAPVAASPTPGFSFHDK
jgi:uncharacterized lipoprotein